MDTREGRDRGLVAEAIRAAQGLGVRLKAGAGRNPRRGTGPLPTAVLRVGGEPVRYAVEVARGVRPATLGPVIHRLRAGGHRALLVADYVTPPVADALRAAGIEFIDAAGNAFLDAPPAFVFVKGQRPAGTQGGPPPGRAFQPTGLQVLFAILARPELLGHPYREIAAAAGVAHGTVGWVMAELPGLGHLATVGGKRRLTNGERLLDRWVEAYARTLRPRRLLGRFRGDLPALQTRERWPAGLLVGGELAAARLTGHLRPGTATFYVPAIEPRAVLELALAADPQGNVELRRCFWNLPAEQPRLTPTLLVYADLLAIGDARCLETAQLLRGQLVDRLV